MASVESRSRSCSRRYSAGIVSCPFSLNRAIVRTLVVVVLIRRNLLPSVEKCHLYRSIESISPGEPPQMLPLCRLNLFHAAFVIVTRSASDLPQWSSRQTITTSISHRRAALSNASRSGRCFAPLPTWVYPYLDTPATHNTINTY